jgi:hypothetical protein
VDEHSSLRVRRHVISSVVTISAVVIGLLLMSLADGAPLNFVRPEHVVDLGVGARANHQGDGNALTPESLERHAADTADVAPPSTAPPATTPTTALLIADRVASEPPDRPTPATTPPTTAAPVVDPRDGSGRSDGDTDGVRTAHRAHVPHIAHVPQLEAHVAHVAHVRHRRHIKHPAHAPHRVHADHVDADAPDTKEAPAAHPHPGRHSSGSSCS